MSSITDKKSWPPWFHWKGNKRFARKVVIICDKRTVNIEQSKRTVTVCRHSPADFWVQWRLEYAHSTIQGGARITPEQLRAAFDIQGDVELATGEHADVCVAFNATVAHIGLFIRKERFLNIPEPGTGKGDDPNISIALTTEIQEAISQLLGDG